MYLGGHMCAYGVKWLKLSPQFSHEKTTWAQKPTQGPNT